MSRTLNIMVLFDFSGEPPPDHDYSEYWEQDHFQNVTHVCETLRTLGHSVTPFGLYRDLQPLAESIKRRNIELVFNLVECIDSQRDFEPHIAAFLELLRTPYTGSGPLALHLCKDKGLTKKILSYHSIRVPKFAVSTLNSPLRALAGLPFPAFVKPLGLEASEGISLSSLAHSAETALERVRFLHEKLQCDVIVEEYIEGREIYVSMLGNSRPQVLPPRELFFDQMDQEGPRFATYSAKWNDSYRKKWGIRSGPAQGIDENELKSLEKLCRKIFGLLHMRGYGRIDLRRTPKGEYVLIEANPNPTITRDEDFALSAKSAGISYGDLLQKIVDHGLSAADSKD